METVKKVRYQTEAARAAKLIRAELKQRFPRTKFRVHSENYSGGNAVRITWALGPCSDAVTAATSKFKAGYFDSSVDCYEYTHSGAAIDETGKLVEMPTVRHISTTREYGETNEESEIFYAKICADYAKLFGWERNDPDSIPPSGDCSNLRQLAWRAIQDCDLTNGYNGLKVEDGRIRAK